ncbi:MAG: hypothetical protein WA784_03985, partial [Albidovulum sp.]
PHVVATGLHSALPSFHPRRLSPASVAEDARKVQPKSHGAVKRNVVACVLMAHFDRGAVAAKAPQSKTPAG